MSGRTRDVDAADRWWLGLSDKTRSGYYRWLDKTKHKTPPPEVKGQQSLFEDLPAPEQEP